MLVSPAAAAASPVADASPVASVAGADMSVLRARRPRRPRRPPPPPLPPVENIIFVLEPGTGESQRPSPLLRARTVATTGVFVDEFMMSGK